MCVRVCREGPEGRGGGGLRCGWLVLMSSVSTRVYATLKHTYTHSHIIIRRARTHTHEIMRRHTCVRTIKTHTYKPVRTVSRLHTPSNRERINTYMSITSVFSLFWGQSGWGGGEGGVWTFV